MWRLAPAVHPAHGHGATSRSRPWAAKEVRTRSGRSHVPGTVSVPASCCCRCHGSIHRRLSPGSRSDVTYQRGATPGDALWAAGRRGQVAFTGMATSIRLEAVSQTLASWSPDGRTSPSSGHTVATVSGISTLRMATVVTCMQSRVLMSMCPRAATFGSLARMISS